MTRRTLQLGILALTLALVGLPGAASAESTTTGTATWYGPGFHGNLTANGEVYDMYDPTTAAANIFPLGSVLRVTNVRNGRSIVVRVNDTGGFDKINPTTVLDLSYAAFAKLADPDDGRIRVSVEPIPAGQAKLIALGESEATEAEFAGPVAAKQSNAPGSSSRFVAY
jgi:rare lipoprotein A